MAVKVLREVPLAEFPAGKGDSIQIRLVEFEGVGVRLDLRRFFLDENGTKVPTNKGVGLRRDWLPKLREAIDLFEREATP